MSSDEINNKNEFGVPTDPTPIPRPVPNNDAFPWVVLYVTEKSQAKPFNDALIAAFGEKLNVTVNNIGTQKPNADELPAARVYMTFGQSDDRAATLKSSASSKISPEATVNFVKSVFQVYLNSQ